MFAILLAAAIAQPLWFTNQRVGESYIVTPTVHLQNDCQCELRVRLLKTGRSGTSSSQQRAVINVAGHADVSLSQIRFNLQPGDKIVISLNLTDGKLIALENTLSLP